MAHNQVIQSVFTDHNILHIHTDHTLLFVENYCGQIPAEKTRRANKRGKAFYNGKPFFIIPFLIIKVPVDASSLFVSPLRNLIRLIFYADKTLTAKLYGRCFDSRKHLCHTRRAFLRCCSFLCPAVLLSFRNQIFGPSALRSLCPSVRTYVCIETPNIAHLK